MSSWGNDMRVYMVVAWLPIVYSVAHVHPRVFLAGLVLAFFLPLLDAGEVCSVNSGRPPPPTLTV